MFKIAIFIGRFQPFHNGHAFVANQGLKISQSLIFLCGSANVNKSNRNPWNFNERKRMINSVFYKKGNINILPLNDEVTDILWLRNIDNIIQNTYSTAKNNIAYNNEICIIGHIKDSSSSYLKLFKNFINIKNFQQINSSDIRYELNKDNNKNNTYLKSVLPDTIFEIIQDI